MPLYEFRCESCGWTLETILAFSDPLPQKCEACGGRLKKLLSAPAVQFKGPGFYLTDYGRSSGNGRRKEGAGNGTKTAAKPGEGAPPSPAPSGGAAGKENP